MNKEPEPLIGHNDAIERVQNNIKKVIKMYVGGCRGKRRKEIKEATGLSLTAINLIIRDYLDSLPNQYLAPPPPKPKKGERQLDIHEEDTYKIAGEKRPRGRNTKVKRVKPVVRKTICLSERNHLMLDALGGSTWIGLLLDAINPEDTVRLRVKRRKGGMRAYHKFNVTIEIESCNQDKPVVD